MSLFTHLERSHRWATACLGLGLAAVMLTTAACGSGSKTRPPESMQAVEFFDFSSLEEMVAASDVVVEGTVVSASMGRVVGSEDPIQFLELELAVERVIYGAPPTGDSATLLIEESTGSIEGPDSGGRYGSQLGDHGYYFLGWKDGLPYYYMLNSEARFLIRDGAVEVSVPAGYAPDEWALILERLTPEELLAHIEQAADAVGESSVGGGVSPSA